MRKIIYLPIPMLLYLVSRSGADFDSLYLVALGVLLGINIMLLWREFDGN
jgi:hypothetical protein